jgi:general nucleoside transport system permease protein
MSSDGGRRRRASDVVEAYFRLAPVTVPLYAILVAIVLGSLVMWAAGANPFEAYAALFSGAFGGLDAIAQSLARSTPFILAALAVAYGFKAGLFNIGVEGQLLIGALAAAWAGTWAWLGGTPPIVAVPVVLAAGIVGGLIWGGIPGVLKARTGAHEVIVTIMLNAVAVRLVEFLVNSRDPVILLDETASVPHTRPITEAARLPTLIPGTGLHWGFIIAVALCAAVWFLLYRTTPGFEIRTVGINPNAARYAGMSVTATIVLTLAVSGAIAGLAGSAEVAGSAAGYLTAGVFRNIGFDSIAVALIARANPFAVIPAALLWGSLLSGAPRMQLEADLSIDIIRIVQALIILFIAADAIVRFLFRIRRARTAEAEETIFATGWGT